MENFKSNYAISYSTDGEDTYKTTLFKTFEKENGQVVWKQIGIIGRKHHGLWYAKLIAKDLNLPLIKNLHTWMPVKNA